MPWIKTVCRCNKPTATEIRKENAGGGSLWQCPKCERVWRYEPNPRMPLGPIWFLEEKVEDEQTPLRTE